MVNHRLYAGGRLRARSGRSKVIQKSVQRFVAGIVRRPIRAIARAGKLDAHGMASASNLPAEGIGTIPATAHHDVIGSAPIVGMHAQTNRGPLKVGPRSLGNRRSRFWLVSRAAEL